MLIVEDGTGLPNAEAYASVATADEYFAKRGFTSWTTITDDEKEQALRRAADYMQQVYRMRWKGTRVKADQGLDWPRIYVVREDYYVTNAAIPDSITGEFYYPSDEVPKEVINANIELAFKAASGDLSPDLTQKVIREKVDVLEVQYDQFSPQYAIYRAIDNLLVPFLISVGGTSRKLVRA